MSRYTHTLREHYLYFLADISIRINRSLFPTKRRQRRLCESILQHMLYQVSSYSTYASLELKNNVKFSTD